jgi:hypothetical protein
VTSDRETTINDIARRFMAVGSLETRGRDADDFHTLGVWAIKDALERAYEAGRAASPPTTCICPACGRDIQITPIPLT